MFATITNIYRWPTWLRILTGVWSWHSSCGRRVRRFQIVRVNDTASPVDTRGSVGIVTDIRPGSHYPYRVYLFRHKAECSYSKDELEVME